MSEKIEEVEAEIIDEDNFYTEKSSNVESKQIVAGILAILFGGLGVRKFILGYNKSGLIMLLITLLTCGTGGAIMGIIGLIEGIIYLTKTEKEFIEEYQINKKEWF